MQSDSTRRQPNRDSGYETLGSPQLGCNGSYHGSVYTSTTPDKGSDTAIEFAPPECPDVEVSTGTKNSGKAAEGSGKKVNNLLRRIKGGLWGTGSLRGKQSIAQPIAQLVNTDGEVISRAVSSQDSERVVTCFEEGRARLERNKGGGGKEKPIVELPLSNPTDATETITPIDEVVQAPTAEATPLWTNDGPDNNRINGTILLRAKSVSSGPRCHLSGLFPESLETLAGDSSGSLYQEINDQISTDGQTIGSNGSCNWHTRTPADSLHSYTGSSDEDGYLLEGEDCGSVPRGRYMSNDKGCTAADIQIRNHSRSETDETVKYKAHPPNIPVTECPVFRFPPPVSQPSEAPGFPNNFQCAVEAQDDMAYTLSLPSSTKSSVYSYAPTTPPSTPILRTPPPEGVDYVPVEIEPFLVPKITVLPGDSMLDMCMEMNKLAQVAPGIFSTPPANQPNSESSESKRLPFGSRKTIIGKTIGRAFGNLFRRNTVQRNRSVG
ncbi:hypothetical protein DFP73DRAFT_592137 [Morchella snyderi]|nr:hypothetical protein DFP73DRAFT_592137 [Morchella snyderi]